MKYTVIATMVLLIIATACEKQGADPGAEAPIRIEMDPHPADLTYTFVDEIELTIQAKDITGSKVTTDVDIEVLNNEGYSGSLSSVTVSNGEGILSTNGSALKTAAKANDDLGLSVAALHVLSITDEIPMRWPFDVNIVSAIAEIDVPTQGVSGSEIQVKYAAETFVNNISTIEIQTKINYSGNYTTLVAHQNIDAYSYIDSIDVILPTAGDTLYLRTNLTADNALTDSREITVRAIATE